VIGVLSSQALPGYFTEVSMPAFSQGLKEASFVEGKNISIEIRLADGHYDRLSFLAAELVRRDVLLARCNDVGLLSEEIDPLSGRMLGNFPQAYSHVGLINCALSLSRQTGPAEERSEAQTIVPAASR
jgi:hypothetical protein